MPLGSKVSYQKRLQIPTMSLKKLYNKPSKRLKRTALRI
jgi:hypothetical protein